MGRTHLAEICNLAGIQMLKTLMLMAVTRIAVPIMMFLAFALFMEMILTRLMMI